jgi:hypothetical protein
MALVRTQAGAEVGQVRLIGVLTVGLTWRVPRSKVLPSQHGDRISRGKPVANVVLTQFDGSRASDDLLSGYKPILEKGLG